jgi:glycopeptide antibiotics resistance protein
MTSFFQSKRLTYGLLFIYLISLVWIIVLKFNLVAYHDGIERSINWIPFPKLFGIPGQGDRNELLLNVLIFMPYGLYAGILWHKWTLPRLIPVFLTTSFLFESSQYFLKYGAFDATDLVNNTLGGILGWLIFQGLKKVATSPKQARKWVNIFALIGTVLILGLLLFLKLNHLWIFRMQLLER